MATETQQATIKIRRDTAANWTSNDPTPNEGEWCLETDTKKIKIGDGSTAWTSLDYNIIPETICTAWVNFNGTGTVAIRDSYNVDSITDLGAGNYRINFTNALADTNYSVSGFVRGDSTTFGFLTCSQGDIKTTSAIALASNRGGAGATRYDSSEVDVHVFGGVA